MRPEVNRAWSTRLLDNFDVFAFFVLSLHRPSYFYVMAADHTRFLVFGNWGMVS